MALRFLALRLPLRTHCQLVSTLFLDAVLGYRCLLRMEGPPLAFPRFAAGAGVSGRNLYQLRCLGVFVLSGTGLLSSRSIQCRFVLEQASALAAIVLAAFLPGWVALAELLGQNVHPVGIRLHAILLALFNIYVLFGSESIAPWVWFLSILVGLAIAVVIFVVVAKGSAISTCMLAGTVFILAAMTLLGRGRCKMGPDRSRTVAAPRDRVTVTSFPRGKWRAVLLFALLLLGILRAGPESSPDVSMPPSASSELMARLGQ